MYTNMSVNKLQLYLFTYFWSTIFFYSYIICSKINISQFNQNIDKNIISTITYLKISIDLIHMYLLWFWNSWTNLQNFKKWQCFQLMSIALETCRINAWTSTKANSNGFMEFIAAFHEINYGGKAGGPAGGQT